MNRVDQNSLTKIFSQASIFAVNEKKERVLSESVYILQIIKGLVVQFIE